eukprot:scaffold576_cov260-Pinguiococcus_pyrenoidosus.AAC.82
MVAPTSTKSAVAVGLKSSLMNLPKRLEIQERLGDRRILILDVRPLRPRRTGAAAAEVVQDDLGGLCLAGAALAIDHDRLVAVLLLAVLALQVHLLVRQLRQGEGVGPVGVEGLPDEVRLVGEGYAPQRIHRQKRGAHEGVRLDDPRRRAASQVLQDARLVNVEQRRQVGHHPGIRQQQLVEAQVDFLLAPAVAVGHLEDRVVLRDDLALPPDLRAVHSLERKGQRLLDLVAGWHLVTVLDPDQGPRHDRWRPKRRLTERQSTVDPP